MHDDGNDIEERRETGVHQLRELPVDGERDGVPEREEVDEAPEGGGHERRHHHEEEPVRAVGPRRGRAGHAQDSEEELDELDDARGRSEVVEVEGDAFLGRRGGGGGRPPHTRLRPSLRHHQGLKLACTRC